MTRPTRYFYLTAAVVTLTAFGAAMAAHAHRGQMVTVPLMDVSGSKVGSASLTQMKDGVRVALDAHGLPKNSELAFHIHEKGVCNGKEAFASAGGHFNPESKAHGHATQGGKHAGDMPNLRTDAEGRINVQLTNTLVTLGKGNNSLMDADGSSLVIHAKADDYRSQPSGDAGGRIVCGVIKGPTK